MQYQIEGRVNGEWHWWNVSADKDEACTLFASEEEAEQVIPKLAECLDCRESDLRVVERADL